MQGTSATRPPAARARLPRAALVLVAASAVASSCAEPAPKAWLASAPRDAGHVEDATPTYYAPDEVDAVARLVTPIEPTYPRAMRAQGREGDVVARVLVRADGSVAGAELLDTSDDAFTAAARARIRDARFAPALLGGAPVPSWVIVRIRFRLA